MPFTLHNGDCLDVLRGMPENSVDSIVTDPPYGLAFMGKRWDYDVPAVEVWAECLRVLKPGGHLLAFAGTRTQHRMAVRIEDAGFEIRDMIAWVYGSGFPKSLDVSKALDKVAGVEREKKRIPYSQNVMQQGIGVKRPWMEAAAKAGYHELQGDEPATEAARQWQGWGTALKPALEPITVARKPLAGTVAANVLEWGTGALNIDGCRVATGDKLGGGATSGHTAAHEGYRRPWMDNRDHLARHAEKCAANVIKAEALGRWPANLIHDGSDEVVAWFPANRPGGTSNGVAAINVDGKGVTPLRRGSLVSRNDTGSAARFFMQCKGDYNDAWQDLNLPQENANTAEQSSSRQRQAAVSALVLAVSSALPEGLLCSGLSMAPFTSATANELRLIAETATQTIQTIGSKFWRESKPARLSLSLNHASDAEIQRLTDTTTITVSRWKSDGSAEPVTFSITPMSLEVGGKDCAPSMDGKRFIYCAKASKKDRGEGMDGFELNYVARENGFSDKLSDTKKPRANNHPTVKPSDLMAYLCRLVTPPGGVVLDPFMGSGSTGKAAMREGFDFIGIEKDAGYFAIAKARIEYAKSEKDSGLERMQSYSAGSFDTVDMFD